MDDGYTRSKCCAEVPKPLGVEIYRASQGGEENTLSREKMARLSRFLESISARISCAFQMERVWPHGPRSAWHRKLLYAPQMWAVVPGLSEEAVGKTSP
jgi:hypothetical protein